MFVCRGRIDIRSPWTQTKDELCGLLKKTDEGRLRQAKSSFPFRTWLSGILCLSQEPACGGEAALTETMVAWGVVCCLESVVANASGNYRTVITIREICSGRNKNSDSPYIALIVWRISYTPSPDDDESTDARRARLQTRMRRSEQLACCCLRSRRNREERTHGCIPVPKGANLSNNALFEVRGIQSMASKSCGMWNCSHSVVLYD